MQGAKPGQVKVAKESVILAFPRQSLAAVFHSGSMLKEVK